MTIALLERRDSRATSLVTPRDAAQTAAAASRPTPSGARTSVWSVVTSAFAAGRAARVVGPRAGVAVAARFADSVRS